MVSITNIFLSLIVLSTLSMPEVTKAQDERFIRNIFTLETEQKIKAQTKWYTSSPYYELDLNQDGLDESIVTQKRDGQDYLNIHGNLKKKLYSFHLTPKGKNSKIYKLSLRRVSSSSKVLIVYYYEGYVKYLDFIGTARLYLINIDNNDLRSINISKGPVFWVEEEQFEGKYSRSKFTVDLFDYNNDGINEVTVKYNSISRVYMYSRPGHWVKI
ncbi:MAG: hypothetical protein ISR65_14380 [Bacteriovoracaceae bacterium]|nr:hypothetical protein [Bacteriovoracaceae bacterium]